MAMSELAMARQHLLLMQRQLAVARSGIHAGYSEKSLLWWERQVLAALSWVWDVQVRDQWDRALGRHQRLMEAHMRYVVGREDIANDYSRHW